MANKRKVIDREAIRHAFVDLGMNKSEISIKFGIGKELLEKTLDEIGINRRRKSSEQFMEVSKDQLINDFFECNMRQSEIAEKYGTNQTTVYRRMKQLGINVPLRGKNSGKKREQTANWKGGKITSMGYSYIYDPDHPSSDSNGYIAEHIVILEKNMGRILSKGEIVHHIDLNKVNNAPENLTSTDRSTHLKWHHQLELIGASLLREGKIAFDHERGYYRVTEHVE